MAKHKKELVLKIEHDTNPDPKFDFIIVPIGMRYNTDLQSLRRGHIIQFLDGTEHYVDSVVKIPIRSSIAESLCRLRYNIGILKAVELWKDRVRLKRLDARVMSEDECLIIFYHKKEVDYVYRKVKTGNVRI